MERYGDEVKFQLSDPPYENGQVESLYYSGKQKEYRQKVEYSDFPNGICTSCRRDYKGSMYDFVILQEMTAFNL